MTNTKGKKMRKKNILLNLEKVTAERDHLITRYDQTITELSRVNKDRLEMIRINDRAREGFLTLINRARSGNFPGLADDLNRMMHDAGLASYATH